LKFLVEVSVGSENWLTFSRIDSMKSVWPAIRVVMTVKACHWYCTRMDSIAWAWWWMEGANWRIRPVWDAWGRRERGEMTLHTIHKSKAVEIELC